MLGRRYSEDTESEPEIQNGWKITEFLRERLVSCVKKFDRRTVGHLYMEKRGDEMWYVGALKENLESHKKKNLEEEKRFGGYSNAFEYLSKLSKKY